jgi:hypothetical protein
MNILLRGTIRVGFLIVALLTSGCDRYGAASGPTVHKPMFRGTPTLQVLRAEARLPDAESAPQPRFKLARSILQSEKDGTV